MGGKGMQTLTKCGLYRWPTVPFGGAPEPMAKAAAVVTLIEAIPVIELLVVSVAVIVSVPAVSSVALKFAVPIVSGESAGSFACPSELVKRTFPV